MSETEDRDARALGFTDAADKRAYETKMLGTPEERLCKRLRERQYVGFTETNANLNEAAQVIERIAAERDAALAEVARMKEGAGWRATARGDRPPPGPKPSNAGAAARRRRLELFPDT